MVRAWVVGVVGLAAAAGGAPGVAADKAENTPGNWASVPSTQAFEAARPAPFAAGQLLRAAATCAVQDSGELANCRIVRESPTNAGVGAALLRLAPHYKRKPPGADGAREATITASWFGADKAGNWVRRPTPDDLMTVYPTEAYRKGLGGHAVIDCVSTVQGALTDCYAIDEGPTGAGFGSAAIALTAQFLMKPATYQGAPAASIVRIPIRFKTYGKGDVSESKKVLSASLPWSQAPTYTDVAAAFPKKAREEKRAGRVTLACEMSEAGRLTKCVVAASDPKNYGFDTAAKALSRAFAYPVTSESDKKATHNVVVHLPITFDPATLDQATPVIGKPEWAGVPKAEQMRAVFSALGLPGTSRVSLQCVVQPTGLVGGCLVVGEEPAGKGLGAAALSLAPAFRMTTWTAEGLPTVGGSIRIPLRYEGGPAETAAPLPQPAPK